ncbi:ABC-2 type transport system ATP-binding protein [Salinibacter ruber]|uniref:ABC transporter ATP-binding protein n=1 Tax=Salinibacter ruber TaxID=146919 RepID=UPI002169C177|nr:ABC transporter ATP-binding protein [Salinibacter ruber]MCS3650061.1 ABC-2 type transport system ATP-binding protein [Salinibacter ruber]MCS3653314.1 ABC-2 type transport system ATP-binding protein [Salinibacter ruber]
MELQIDDVSKTYGDGTEAVRDVSLTVSEGLIGLLGPNGAGKSTLMRLIATITTPTAGTLRWNGTDIVDRPVAMRRTLGYLPQDFGVYPELTAAEFLNYMAALKGVSADEARSRIGRLLEITRLEGARGRRLGGFSGGMIQRVGIACALLNDPDLLVADEPTVGLDPEERARFRALLTDLAEERVVLLSTHIVSDVEATASRLAIMRDGRLAATAAPEALIDRVRDRVWEWVVGHDELGRVRDAYRVTKATRGPGGVRVHAVAEQPPSAEATPAEPTLEDAYLSLLSGPTSPR